MTDMQKLVSVGLALPFVALFGTILLGGCPGELENPDRFKTDGGGASAACFDIPKDLFVKRCAQIPNCHSAAMPINPPNLDHESPGVEDRLVNKPGSATCPGILVNPADAEGSILYKKLTSSPGCGTRMPQVGTPLDQSELDCVKQWIESLGAGGAGPGAGGAGGMGVGGMGGMGGSMGGMGGAMGGAGGT
jgi:hypothetical protein